MSLSVEKNLEKLIKISEDRLKVEKEALALERISNKQAVDTFKVQSETLKINNVSILEIVEYIEKNSDIGLTKEELLEKFLNEQV